MELHILLVQIGARKELKSVLLVGHCVYKGTASGASVAMSNLSQLTDYYFKAYAFNDCGSNPKFYTTATLSGNTTTTCDAPTGQPTGSPTFSSTTTTATTWGTLTLAASSDNTVIFCREGASAVETLLMQQHIQRVQTGAQKELKSVLLVGIAFMPVQMRIHLL